MGYILCENVLRSATITSESTIANFPIASALDGRTATNAGFDDAADREVVFDLGAAISIDTLAIGRNNLSTKTVTIAGSSDNVSYTNITGFISITTSSKVYSKKLASPVSYRYYRLTVGSGVQDGYIADIALGQAVDLERSQKHGFIKPEFAEGDRIIPNVTEGNNLAGLYVKQGFKRCKFSLFYYTASFFTTNWQTIINEMKSYPIYIVWDTPETELPFYCWAYSKMPEPSYAKNINGYYNATLSMEGITE